MPDELAQRELANEATEQRLRHAQTKSTVKQRKVKSAPKSRGFKPSFFAENGIKVTVSAPKNVTYDEIEVAIGQAQDEVRHYINQSRTVL